MITAAADGSALGNPGPSGVWPESTMASPRVSFLFDFLSDDDAGATVLPLREPYRSKHLQLHGD